MGDRVQRQHPGVTVEHQPVPTRITAPRCRRCSPAARRPTVHRYLQEMTPIVTVAEKTCTCRWTIHRRHELRPRRTSGPGGRAVPLGRQALCAAARLRQPEHLLQHRPVQEGGRDRCRRPTGKTRPGPSMSTLKPPRELTRRRTATAPSSGAFSSTAGSGPWASLVYNNGGTVVKKDDRGVATEMALDQPDAVEALQFLQDLMYTHGVAPRPDPNRNRRLRALRHRQGRHGR